MTGNSLLKGIKSRFISLLDPQYVNPYSFLTEYVDSQSDHEDYIVGASLPGIKELLDEVKFSETGDFQVAVQNKDYYDSIREERNRIDDSKEYLSNSVELRIRGIANVWTDFDAQMIEDFLNTYSTTYSAFDGTVFFSTARNNLAGVAISTDNFSNTSTGTAITMAGIETDLTSEISKIESLKDINGKALNRNPAWFVICSPSAAVYFDKLLSPTAINIDTTGTVKSNVWAGKAQVIRNYSASNNSWYLVNAKRKPFLIQNRKSPEWYMEDNEKTKFVDFWMKARKGFCGLDPLGITRVTTG